MSQWPSPGNGSAAGAWGPPGSVPVPSPVAPAQSLSTLTPPGGTPKTGGEAHVDDASQYDDNGAAWESGDAAYYSEPGYGAGSYDAGADVAAHQQAYDMGDDDGGVYEAGEPYAIGAAAAPSRLDGLQSEVASLKIRGARTRVERQVRVGGAALMVIGLVLIAVAWFQASAANTSVNNQIAYLMSGGLIGLSLVAIGGAVYLRSWMARQRYWQARQVVESRQYTGQVLELLARIEKLLGGSGELPGEPGGSETGSLWETVVSPPAREQVPVEPLVGDPSATLDEGPGDTSADVAAAAAAGTAPSAPSTPAERLTASGGAAQNAGDAAPASSAPLYTNDHGHIWDHASNQWYDPATHQWFDGIAGQWYRRDTPPPSA